jgi:hypothetical protein
MYSMSGLTSTLDTRHPGSGLQARRAAWLQLFSALAGITGSVVDQPSPDAEVCRLIAEGRKDQAFERLLAAYRGKVYRLALSYVRMPADAEDLAQEAFVRLWRALPLYDGRASFSTWLYVIARNACLSELRRRGSRPTAALEAAPEPAAAPTPAPDQRRAAGCASATRSPPSASARFCGPAGRRQWPHS